MFTFCHIPILLHARACAYVQNAADKGTIQYVGEIGQTVFSGETQRTKFRTFNFLATFVL